MSSFPVSPVLPHLYPLLMSSCLLPSFLPLPHHSPSQTPPTLPLCLSISVYMSAAEPWLMLFQHLPCRHCPPSSIPTRHIPEFSLLIVFKANTVAPVLFCWSLAVSFWINQVVSVSRSGREEDDKEKNYRTHSQWHKDEDNIGLIGT